MSSRADKLVQIAEEARDKARRIQAAAMDATEKAARHLDAEKSGLAAARAERDELNTRGGSESSFQESDAWVRSREGRVVRAHDELVLAQKALAAAKDVTQKAMIRVEQMCALRERARDAARLKEVRAERRAEDERLARRATTR